MSVPQVELRAKLDAVLKIIGEDLPAYCFQCVKCTAGCEAMKLLELQPHKVIALCKIGFVDELVNSDIIWKCMMCFKCKERCPQMIAPVDIIFVLKNIAVSKGKQLHESYTTSLQSLLTRGLIQDIKKVLTSSKESVDRTDLNLPPLTKPADISKFSQILMKVATQTF
jgi:heterodisulfide reductase subunit C